MVGVLGGGRVIKGCSASLARASPYALRSRVPAAISSPRSVYLFPRLLSHAHPVMPSPDFVLLPNRRSGLQCRTRLPVLVVCMFYFSHRNC